MVLPTGLVRSVFTEAVGLICIPCLSLTHFLSHPHPTLLDITDSKVAFSGGSSHALCCKDPLRLELEERLRQQHHMELQTLREAHRQNIETLKQQSEQELQTLRFELEDEGKAMLASLRSELNHLHASAIEHMRQTHQQETAAAKQELENALEQSRVKVNFIHSVVIIFHKYTFCTQFIIVVSSIFFIFNFFF
ncbi:Protein FAM184A [Labeo rohita]|uniref:Protein FAM184A n=1 Tax=Labeo rohita TaxID=84645 RepID=A0ABQ8LNF9_LABRO|nr:Protein FAM184A [Labeo rohita]